MQINKPKSPPKLTKTEEDLLSQLTNGYQLESNPLEHGLLLRKGEEVIRTASANQSTVKALEDRGLISATRGTDKLTTIWRAKDTPPKRGRSRSRK